MELKVYRQDGSDAGRTVTLDESVFGIEPNDHAIWLDVRRIQAHARQGTHKSKERSETAGSTRKLYRQKGTGGARAGDAKSPTRRSGGTMFGPKPHAYSLKVNRKTQLLARRSALTYKAQGEALRVVEDFTVEAASTKKLMAMLEALKVSGRSVLVLTGGHDANTYRSGRNIERLKVRSASNASTLDLLGAQVIVLQQGAVDVLVQRLGSTSDAA